jgi:hypothetical protein
MSNDIIVSSIRSYKVVSSSLNRLGDGRLETHWFLNLFILSPLKFFRLCSLHEFVYVNSLGVRYIYIYIFLFSFWDRFLISHLIFLVITVSQ